ncbi:hypothetical protein TRFO_12309 [Tritrichomonas foetus]|uniref:Uncharacterized protein n=1 Tax=Tritrichomonas foetus TaxID=1144522 RepID=A0A1J4J6F0_9EUKA|nr:hypothetical protein TRFO_12309 [Tritrichomonas foetus]|eukprot:OHS92756.1 hypothetical protein TRFO_12309 [Tritrichomonas foetus]
MRNNNFLCENILMQYLPIAESSLIKVAKQLDSNQHEFENKNFHDPSACFPRNVIEYENTVNSFVDIGIRAPEASVTFLSDFFPGKKLNTMIISKFNCQTKFKECYDIFLALFFADCSVQIISGFKNDTKNENNNIFESKPEIIHDIFDTAIYFLQKYFDSLNIIEKQLNHLLLRQFSVLFSILSSEGKYQILLLEKFNELITANLNASHKKGNNNEFYKDCLCLFRFIRLNSPDGASVEDICKHVRLVLKLLLKISSNENNDNNWSSYAASVLMQLSSETASTFIDVLNEAAIAIESKILEQSPSKDDSKVSSNISSNNDFIYLMAVVIVRGGFGKKINSMKKFINDIILPFTNYSQSTVNISFFLGSLNAFLVLLRGPFISRANNFWEWGKRNFASHPGIEFTHISDKFDLKESTKLFFSIIKNSINYLSFNNLMDTKVSSVIGDILIHFASRHFTNFIQNILPSFIELVSPKKAFPSIASCLTKMADKNLRFSDWAQENPENFEVNIRQLIPLLFLQLKPTVFAVAQSAALKTVSYTAFSIDIKDSSDYPIVKLPVVQKGLVNLRKKLKEKQKEFDLHDEEKISNDLNDKEKLFVDALLFFPRIMNRGDISSPAGCVLLNTIVCDCAAASKLAINVLNHFFCSHPNDRDVVFRAVITKAVEASTKEHTFLYTSFLASLFNLSLAPRNSDRVSNGIIQRTEALCIYLLFLNSPSLDEVALDLAEKVYKFASALHLQAFVFLLLNKYKIDIEKSMIKHSTPISIEIMRLMNLKASNDFFEAAQEIFASKLAEKKETYLINLLAHSIRYVPKVYLDEISNQLQYLQKAHSEDYPLQILVSDLYDQSSEKLIEQGATKYLIENSSSLTHVHWTSSYAILLHINEQIKGKKLLASEIFEYISILDIILQAPDINVALLAGPEARNTTILIMNEFIHLSSNDSLSATASASNGYLMAFCRIVSNFMKSFVVPFTGTIQGPLLPPRFSSFLSDDENFSRIAISSFDYLISSLDLLFRNTDTKGRNEIFTALTTIACSYPIYDVRKLTDDKNIISFLNSENSGDNDDILYYILCMNQSLIQYYIENSFYYPRLLKPLAKLFTGVRNLNFEIDENCQSYNNEIASFAPQIIFSSLLEIALDRERSNGFIILSRLVPLFAFYYKIDTVKISRFTKRLEKISFIITNSNHIALEAALKAANLISSLLEFLKDDFVNFAVELIIKIHEKQKSNQADHNYSLEYENIQKTVLQLLEPFIRLFSLTSSSSNKLFLIEKLLYLYNFLISETLKPYVFYLFDTIASQSSESLEFIINILSLNKSKASSYVLSNFASNNPSIVLKKLAERISFTTWYANTIEGNFENEEPPKIDNESLFLSPIRALAYSLAQSKFIENIQQYSANIVCFCLIFSSNSEFKKDAIQLLSSFLSFASSYPNNSLNNSPNSSLNDSLNDSIEINEFDGLKNNEYLNECNIPQIVSFFLKSHIYGRKFVIELGTECIRWCCGCGDLKIAANACNVFACVLKPFDTSTLSSFARSLSVIARCLNVEGSLEYLRGVIKIFSAAASKYSSSRRFAASFRSLFKICSVLLSSMPPDPHICITALEVTARYISSYSIFSFNKKGNNFDTSSSKKPSMKKLDKDKNDSKNKQMKGKSLDERIGIQFLYILARIYAILRPQSLIDANILSLFKNPELNTKNFAAVSFLIFLPRLHAALSAYHNIYPFTDTFSDSEIISVLHVGALISECTFLPSILATIVSSASKEPEKVSPEDFIRKVGHELAMKRPDSVILAAPALIQMIEHSESTFAKAVVEVCKGILETPSQASFAFAPIVGAVAKREDLSAIVDIGGLIACFLSDSNNKNENESNNLTYEENAILNNKIEWNNVGSEIVLLLDEIIENDDNYLSGIDEESESGPGRRILKGKTKNEKDFIKFINMEDPVVIVPLDIKVWKSDAVREAAESLKFIKTPNHLKRITEPSNPTEKNPQISIHVPDNHADYTV